LLFIDGMKSAWGTFGMMVDFQTTYDVLDELHSYVASEPSLAAFVSGVREVRDQALALARGHRSVPVMPPPQRRILTDRALAEKIVEIVSRLPPVYPGSSDPASVRLGAQLRGNLVVAITYAVFDSFPELLHDDPLRN
jgi:hypothetical protein